MRRRYLYLASLVVVAAPVAAPAQLPYDRTTFLNGFASDSMIWRRGYHDLSGMTSLDYLGQFVDLRVKGFPNVHPGLRYDRQLDSVAPFFAAGGQHVAVGHSLGSLVARGIYIHDVSLARQNIAGIVATVAPHRGLPLASNVDEAKRFFADAQRRIDNAEGAVKITIGFLLLVAAFTPLVYSIFLAAIAGMLAGFGLVGQSGGGISNVDQFLAITEAPALADLDTASAAVRTLTTRFEDGSIPRVNIYGTIPHRNAVLRLAKSIQDEDYDFENAVIQRNAGLKAFKLCKAIGYATIVLSSKARKCSNAAKVLMRLDDQWVKYVNGWDSNGRPRYVPFDGAVPNERSVYPSVNGVNYDAPVSGVNHVNVYKTRAGLNKVAEGMIQIDMVQLSPPPSGGGGGRGGGGGGGGGCTDPNVCVEPMNRMPPPETISPAPPERPARGVPKKPRAGPRILGSP